MRTFSKAYGLAGLRCGYAFGHEDTMRVFDKVRNHYGMNRMAQAACLAALDDQDYLAGIVQRTAACRERIAEIAAARA
jgi:histidinol-phosphate aminotransferase